MPSAVVASLWFDRIKGFKCEAGHVDIHDLALAYPTNYEYIDCQGS